MSFNKPKSFRDMKRELEYSEHKNPINMTDNELREESLQLARLNPTGIYITEEQKMQEKRHQELFEENSNRAFERVHGERPPPKTIKERIRTPPQPLTEQLPETEKQATTLLKFAFGVIQPRKIK